MRIYNLLCTHLWLVCINDSCDCTTAIVDYEHNYDCNCIQSNRAGIYKQQGIVTHVAIATCLFPL